MSLRLDLLLRLSLERLNLKLLNYVGLGLFLLALIDSASAQPDCRPQPDRERPQYIIGYGSLMENASKRRTAPLAGENLPVRVTGYQWGWYVRSGVMAPTTFLGVIPQPSAQMNAVIYRLALASELEATDRRESGYCRWLVPPEQIVMLDRSVRPDGQIWIYARSPIPDRAKLCGYCHRRVFGNPRDI